MNIVLCSHEEEQRALAHGIVLCTEDEADFLMHYRTKGSVNGIRRYQYEDGSLTPEGYIHYGIGQGNKNKAKAEKYQAKVNKAQAKAAKYQVKVDKYNKRAEEQEERGKAKFESDKQKQADDEAKEAKKTHDKEVVQKINDLTDRMSKYDSMSDDEKKSFGDDLLRGIKEYNEWQHNERIARGYKVGEAHFIEGFNNSRKLEGDLFDKVFEKSGHWNGESWVKGSNAEKAYPAVDKAYTEMWNREEEVKKQIGYKPAGFNPKPGVLDGIKRLKQESETKRLQNALKSDKIYLALQDQAGRAERDLAGAILQDLGFSDTPENRTLIWPYTYFD